MNKDDFFKTLDAALSDFSWSEKKDIIYDYEEHFRIGFENGKTEAELIEELGDPKDIANQYKSNSTIESEPIDRPINNYNENKYSEYKNTSENVSVLAAIALLIFNLIFIVGPFLGLAGALIGLFGGAIGAFIGGLGLTLGTIFYPFAHDFLSLPVNISSTASIFFGIGTTAFGALFFIGDCYLAKYFLKFTMKYINWNLSIIKR
jgi:uncharacterized membrane protein